MRRLPLSHLIYLCSLGAGFAVIAVTVFGSTIVGGLS